MQPADQPSKPFLESVKKRKPPGILKGLGKLLSPKPTISPRFVPPSPAPHFTGTSTSTALPFVPPVPLRQEYPGALQKSSIPTVRSRHNSLPTKPVLLRSDSWPQNSGTPSSYNPRAGTHKRSASYSANAPIQNQGVPYDAPSHSAYPSFRKTNQHSHNALSGQKGLDSYGYAIERPLNFKQNFELHTYLCTPPFSYSFLNKPDTITRKGFNGIHQYATRPPIAYMIIESPHLPWTIRIGGRGPDDKYLSVSEVFTTIYEALQQSPTPAELKILYSSSESKKKYREIISAYHKRSKRESPYQQDYIRKVDWLCGRDVFDGLIRKKDKSKPVWLIRFRGADDARSYRR